jgi:uncharacterized membrane protein YdbT with pleckstrin-like domain
MAYVDSILQPGETVRAVGKLHWIAYARAAVFAGIALLLAFLISGVPGMPGGYAFVAVAWLVAVGEVLRTWIKSLTTEIAITDRRVIYKRGLISRHTAEMNMNEVETVNVQQTVLGRILGFGTIQVRGTGEGIAPLPGIASPLRLRNAIAAR